MIDSAREDVMDDLSNYVLEVAVLKSVDVGWRQVEPLVVAARATTNPRAYIDHKITRMKGASAKTSTTRIVDLEEVLRVFRKDGDGGSHAGRLSRFVVELFGEELHATLFSHYLTEQTGTPYRILYQQPKSADGSHKKWLDCYVGPNSVVAGGDPRLHRIFACEVKSWNDNGLHSWSPTNKKGVDRIEFYSSWLHDQLPVNDRLSKLREAYRLPQPNSFAEGLALENALLIYHPQLVSGMERAVPEGDKTQAAFWTDLHGTPLLVFSGENYILHLQQKGVWTLEIESEALRIKLDRVGGLFLS